MPPTNVVLGLEVWLIDPTGRRELSRVVPLKIAHESYPSAPVRLELVALTNVGRVATTIYLPSNVGARLELDAS